MSVILKKIENKKDLSIFFSRVFKDFNISPDGSIFIKPNLSARPPIKNGENTSVEFARALIEGLLHFDNVKKIIIGHSPLLGTADKIFTFETLINGSGFRELTKLSDKIELLNLDEVERQLMSIGQYKFHLPKMLFDGNIDLSINIGALKTHMETTVSLSLKNQMGLLPAEERKFCHQSGELEERVASIGALFKPDLNFIDGLWGMEGNGPHHGEAVEANLVLAGKDMVELDALTASIINLDYKSIRHIVFAKDLGVGNFPSNELKSDFSRFKINFSPAKLYEKFGKNIYVWPTDGCSKCITALNESGKFFKKNPIKARKFLWKAYFGNQRINIVIGNAKNLNLPQNEKIICVGHCPKKFSERCGCGTLDKCPPTVSEVYDYLNKNI